MTSAVFSYQFSSPARWSGESDAEEGAPTEIDRSVEVIAKSNASPATEESVPRAFEVMIGAREPPDRVMTHVKTVAPTDTTALLDGDTGTGKKVTCQAIHTLIQRTARMFVKL